MRCIGFDRRIDTDRPIAGTLPGVVDRNGGDGSDGRDGRDGGDGTDRGDAIRIVWHAPASPPRAERPVWTRTQDALWFDPPGVARYRCTPERIEITPIAGADPAHVDALLIATALPASLWLQGDIVLHAAAVIPAGDARALAIAGPSGCGKSHLAATLLARGARLVADDSIAVRGTTCAGLAGGYHLGGRGDQERPFHRIPEARSCRAAPLGTVIVLDDRPEPFERLNGVAAVQALLAGRHRASVPRLCGFEPRVLAGIARLAQAVRVFRGSQHSADMLLDSAIRARVMEG